MLRAMSGVQLKKRKGAKYLMLMMGLNETIDQLAMINSVRCCGHELRTEVSHDIRRILDLEVEDQRKKRRLKKTWTKQVEEKSVMVSYR